jgi:hypothetical protein
MVRHDPQSLLFSSRTWSFDKEYTSGVISGTVVNFNTVRGIGGAVVETEGGEYSTITETNGSFRLTSVSEGSYTITVTDERYSAYSKSDINVADGENITIIIALEPLFNAYSITGQISGDVKEGVVNLKNEEEILLTSEIKSDGSYSFNGVENGSYTVIPDMENSVFAPSFHEVEIDDEDLSNIDFKAMAESCPAQVALEDDLSSLNLLRIFRNKVLAKNKMGRKYTNLYYTHALELTTLVIAHEEIREDMKELVLDIMPDITTILKGEEVILGSGKRESIEDLIDSLESYASSELKKTLNMIKKDISKKEVLQKLGVITP